jgi:NTE family protein
MGNPAIFPLIYGCESPDVIIVHINPMTRPSLPKTATEIMNRLNEISFNSSLMREMRAVAFVSRLIENGQLTGDNVRHMLIHSIEAHDFMCELGVASKLNADWEFLTHLRDQGRERTEAWLKVNFDRINVEGTIDIRQQYL